MTEPQATFESPPHVEPLLRVESLSKHFPVTKGVFGRVHGHVRAVDDVSFEIEHGETLGLVGESGCGKSTVGRALLRLHPPTSGRVWFGGRNLAELTAAELQSVRRDMQIVFQDPYSSLNPRMRVFDIVGEALAVHGVARGEEQRRRVFELLDKVGVSARWADRYAHEFSGGQRQRIGIARAIALNPKLLVCDEAVSALDVSIQAQVINLLIRLREQLGLSYLFISHDLSVVRHISHRVMVMYLGQVVELGPTAELFEKAAHPYTRALLSAVPVADPRHVPDRVVLGGDVPSPLNPPSGCRFHTRCPAAFDRCGKEAPQLYTLGTRRTVRCFLAEGLAQDGDWYAELSSRLDAAERTRQERAGLTQVREGAPVGADHGDLESAPNHAAPANGRANGADWIDDAVLPVESLFPPVNRASLNEPPLSPLRRAFLACLLATVALGAFAASRGAARQAQARREAAALAAEVSGQLEGKGQLPKSLGALGYRMGFALGRRDPTDPWGNAYQYRQDHEPGSFALWSAGPDGKSQTKDDIVAAGAP